MTPVFCWCDSNVLHSSVYEDGCCLGCKYVVTEFTRWRHGETLQRVITEGESSEGAEVRSGARWVARRPGCKCEQRVTYGQIGRTHELIPCVAIMLTYSLQYVHNTAWLACINGIRRNRLFVTNLRHHQRSASVIAAMWLWSSEGESVVDYNRLIIIVLDNCCYHICQWYRQLTFSLRRS